MAIKSIFAKALLLCCASLVSQYPVTAQESFAPSPEEFIDDSESLPGIDPDADTKHSPNVGGAKIDPDTSPVPDPVPLPAPVEVSSKVGGKRNLLERAYLDAFKILAEPNKCSKLLGGRHSIKALNELVQQMRTTSLPRTVAMQMSGPTTTYQSHMTGFTFRMFQRADLNLDGVFFRGNGVNQPRLPMIGGFAPNTREARVTILLHELGHLIRGADKRWLLPDDGGNELLSLVNTSRILDACRSSIKQVTDEN